MFSQIVKIQHGCISSCLVWWTHSPNTVFKWRFTGTSWTNRHSLPIPMISPWFFRVNSPQLQKKHGVGCWKIDLRVVKSRFYTGCCSWNTFLNLSCVISLATGSDWEVTEKSRCLDPILVQKWARCATLGNLNMEKWWQNYVSIMENLWRYMEINSMDWFKETHLQETPHSSWENLPVSG